MKVFLASCSSYDEIEEKIRDGIEAIGGISQFVKQKDNVLLKPNLLGFYKPERGITTHPSFVQAIARIVKRSGANPIIADSPGMGISYTKWSLKRTYEVCEMDKIEDAILNYDVGIGRMGRFEVIKPACDCELIINIPKLKTHSLTILTGAVKNLYGLIPGLAKLSYHSTHRDRESFSKLLFELLENIKKPQLTIMDGIIGMDGDGPADGNLRPVGIIIISDDPILADLVALKIIGIPISLIPELEKRSDIFEKGEFFGEPLNDLILKKPFALPTSASPWGWLGRYLKPVLTVKPVIRNNCDGCGTCVKVCLQQAIKLENKKAKISDGLCIRCYCCQESCPNQAIGLKRSFSNRLILKIAKTRLYRIFEEAYHFIKK